MIVEDENTVSTTGKTNFHLCRKADSHTFPLIPWQFKHFSLFTTSIPFADLLRCLSRMLTPYCLS